MSKVYLNQMSAMELKAFNCPARTLFLTDGLDFCISMLFDLDIIIIIAIFHILFLIYPVVPTISTK